MTRRLYAAVVQYGAFKYVFTTGSLAAPKFCLVPDVLELSSSCRLEYGDQLAAKECGWLLE